MIYATKYANVLLIDADLRKATQHRYLKLSNSRGLTNALIEYGETKKLVQNVSNSLKMNRL